MQMHAPNMTRPVGPSATMNQGQGMDPRQRMMLQQQHQQQQQQQQHHQQPQPMLQARPPPPSQMYPPLHPENPSMTRTQIPPDVEPTFEDIRNMTTIDMGVARYRSKHGYMNEIFDSRSVASIETASKASVKPVDLATLEAQAKQMEETNERLELTNNERLQQAKERFAALKRGETVSLDQDQDQDEDEGEKQDVEVLQEKRDVVMS